MIRAIHLHPFAGIRDRSVHLLPGLNVVHGPNEAGKTTLVNALSSALFVPTNLTPAKFAREMNRHLPIGGGNTIRVALEFENRGAYCRLSKQWGPQSQSELELPGGELITGPDEVQGKLESFLGLKRGTYEHVLMAYQSHLPRTLENLSGESQQVQDLSALLRAALFLTDGVSIEALEITIRKRLENHFSRWDGQLQRPENNRDIDNPWKNRVGTLLHAYYDRETLRRERKQAEDFEREMDSINEQLNAFSREKDGLEKFVSENAPIAEDAKNRARLEAQREAFEAKERALKEISLEWPRQEERLRILRKDHGERKDRLDALTEELARSQAFEGKRSKREQLDRAEKKASTLADANVELSRLKAVAPDNLRDLEELDQDLLTMSASLRAGRLRMKLIPRVDFSVVARKDLEAEINIELQAGIRFEQEAGGRILVRHHEWELEVQSGEISFDQLSAEHENAQKRFNTLLQELGAENLETVQEWDEDYHEKKSEIERLEAQLKEILGETDLQDLRKELGNDQEDETPRSSTEIALELGRLGGEQEGLEARIQSTQEDIDVWVREFQSQDQLLDVLVDACSARNANDDEIALLKPLPEGIEDAESFIADFDSKNSRLQAIKQDELPDLLIEKSNLANATPEKSLQELDEELREAEARFERCLKEGRALNRICAAFKELRQELDRGTLDPWIANLEGVLKPLTGGRYSEIHLETAEAGRADDLAIPYEGLSMGTRGCLGLAIRLSMARHFLENRDGFLLLDDPLVDLDPRRQEAAAAILRHFAEEHQIIILTCHPRHAELLGGHQVEMESVIAKPAGL